MNQELCQSRKMPNPDTGLCRSLKNNLGQDLLMKFDPATGEQKPYPSHAAQWREYHGMKAWLFNPWYGNRRNASDVGSDTFGHLICAD